MKNWAGNLTYSAARVERPTSVDELSAIVAAADRVRAVGSRHCFNDVADTTGTLVSTEHLRRIDPVAASGAMPTVTVDSGVTYGQLGPTLHEQGYALPNLASLPHITVAGAAATATHGSGEGNGCLSTSVAGIEFILADGSVRTVRRGDANFDGVVVHLGALGVVSRLTLDVVPTFEIEQTVIEGVPMDAFAANLDAIVGSVYSVSGFTNWKQPRFHQVWLKAKAGVTPFDLTRLGGTRAARPLHPIEGLGLASDGAEAAACTQQLGVAGPWHERLTHFRNEFTPSSGDELQSEYFVPREHAAAAIAAVAPMGEQIAAVVQTSEIRFIAADELWMSMFYRRASVALHFTWRNDWPAVRTLLPKIEATLAPFGPRPHWGKLFTMSRESLLGVTPNAGRFRELRGAFDSLGKFQNAYGERHGL